MDKYEYVFIEGSKENLTDRCNPWLLKGYRITHASSATNGGGYIWHFLVLERKVDRNNEY